MSPLRLCATSLLALLAAACQKAPRSSQGVPNAPSADSGLGVAATDTAARSAARFAQDFYDWYAHQGENADRAVKARPTLLAPELLAALRADVAAQARSPDDIVGIDWDPFLNTQDPCNPYRVGQVTRRGDTLLIAVKGFCKDAAPRPGPDVIAEVAWQADRWVFVDFRHAEDRGSLLQDLARLKLARDSTRTAPR